MKYIWLGVVIETEEGPSLTSFVKESFIELSTVF